MHAYTLIRSKRKTIALEIKPSLEIVVRAPLRMPRAEIEGFVGRHQAWLDTHLARLRARAERFPEPTPEQIEALRSAAKATLPGRVAHYAERMGLSPTGVKITSARQRFGSCSARNSLCFSCLLMRYPDEAIDYVVVHELAHIVHKNHGKAFYALIAQHMPDYAARRALLRSPR